MELAVLKNTLPLKAYPENKLDEILSTKFKYWLSQLLSIKSDNEEKVDIALPIIKKKFWSLGIDEVTKAFEMYALGELGITPKSNYFDIILVGQIFNEYKKQKPQFKNPVPKIEISEEEKELKWISFIINCFEEYKYSKTMLTGYTAIYDHFYALDKFPIHNHQFREKVRQRALVKLQTGNKDLTNYEIVLEGKKPNYSEENITNTAKEIILSDWFDELIKNKVDIKTEI